MKYCKDCKFLNKDNLHCQSPLMPRDMVTGERETGNALHWRNRPLTGCAEEARWFEPIIDLDDYTASLFSRVGATS